jgi:hypothetical protein
MAPTLLAGEVPLVSETRATNPVFPPGRYGRRRDGRRRVTGPILAGVLVTLVAALLVARLYGQYGDPNYDSQIVGWSDVTETRITVEFTVRVPAGGSATCGLRARSFDGAEVGRRTVTVAAKGTERSVTAREVVETTGRAAVGEVVRCAAAK